jgi:HemY protein
MSYLGIFVLVLALGTGCGFLIAEDPGYALFSYQNWTVEMPLWLSFALMFISVAALGCLLWIGHWLQGSSQKIKQWMQSHQQQNARIQTNKGLLALSAGRFQEAERYLSQSAAHSDQALVNYLYAAQAAQLLGAFDRRDHYLERASKIKEHSPVAVELTQATLNLKAGRLQEEVPHLEALYHENPKNTQSSDRVRVWALSPKWRGGLVLLLCRMRREENGMSFYPA